MLFRGGNRGAVGVARSVRGWETRPLIDADRSHARGAYVPAGIELSLVPSSDSGVAGPGLLGRALHLRVRRRFLLNITADRVRAGRWRRDG
jgi:hypothetical protein